MQCIAIYELKGLLKTHENILFNGSGAFLASALIMEARIFGVCRRKIFKMLYKIKNIYVYAVLKELLVLLLLFFYATHNSAFCFIHSFLKLHFTFPNTLQNITFGITIFSLISFFLLLMKQKNHF